MRTPTRNARRSIISATEIAEYAYCAKAWHLKRLGEAAQSERLRPGERFHLRHSTGLSVARKLRRVGFVCALIAGLLLLFALLVRE